MTCNCNNNTAFRPVRGNAFKLRIAVKAYRMDGSLVQDFVLDDSATLLLTTGNTVRPISYEVEDNCAIVSFDGSLACGYYGLDFSGVFNDEEWRFAAKNVFNVVELTAQADIPSDGIIYDDTYLVEASVTLATLGPQADWDENDEASQSYIKNKPTMMLVGGDRETGKLTFYGRTMGDVLTTQQVIANLHMGVQLGIASDIYDPMEFSEQGEKYLYHLVRIDDDWLPGKALYELECNREDRNMSLTIYLENEDFYFDERLNFAIQPHINDLDAIRSGAAAGASALQPNEVYVGGDDTGLRLYVKSNNQPILLTTQPLSSSPFYKTTGAPWKTLVELLSTKQNVLTFDDLPTPESSNPVKSSGILAALNAMVDFIKDGLGDGTIKAKAAELADNIASWADRTGLSVDDTFTDIVRTAAGDASIDSSQQAKLISIFAKTDFAATELKTTGFNLLHGATQVGSGYYFLVPSLPFGTYGTAEKPNGVLFTNSNGENLQPTVYFKPLASGVPTSTTDGTAITPTTAGGLKFYATSQPGYMIVSDITYADTCAHVAWSRRYNEFISPTDAGDAGSSIALTSIINAVHDYGLLLSIAGGPSDGIIFGDTAATWYRYCDRVKPTWTNEEQEEAGTYLHTATISGMKSGGAVECSGIQLNVDGTTISYIDNSATATTEWVKYELAAVATGTTTISPLISVEDWGLEELIGATGTAYITMQYAQNYPDALAALASTLHSWNIRVLVEAVAWLDARCKALESMIDNAGDLKARNIDSENMPMVCGYSMAVEGAGAPSVVPRFVGQHYVDTTNRKVYLATRVTNATSDWTLLN